MKHMLSLWFFSAACIALLWGCGRGGVIGSNGLNQNFSQNISRTGKLTLTIQWPARTRLIPEASNSILVSLAQGSSILSSQVLPRPSSGSASTVSFTNLPSGALTLSASAFPTVNGIGVAQAQGSSVVTVVAGQTAAVTVNMNSTISTLSLTPNPLIIGTGQTTTLAVNAKDSINNIVMLTPGKLTWASSNTAAAIVDSNGVVTGVSTAQTTITVTDAESGKSGAAIVNSVAPVSWWKAENNALDAEGNNNGTVSGGVTYGPGKIGQGFIFNGIDGVVNLGDPDSLKFTSSFTIDCWVQTNAIPSASQLWDNIFFRGDDRSGLDPCYLAVNQDGLYHFQIDQDFATHTELTAPVVLSVLQHLTCTLDGNTGDMRFYVNAKLVGELTTTIRPFRDLDPTSIGGVAIGNAAGAPASSYHYPHNGIIDELKVYNAVVPPLN